VFTVWTLGRRGDETSADELGIAKIRVSERLDHSRPEVTSSYFGMFNVKRKATIR
jgi:hypothetical protein